MAYSEPIKISKSVLSLEDFGKRREEKRREEETNREPTLCSSPSLLFFLSCSLSRLSGGGPLVAEERSW